VKRFSIVKFPLGTMPPLTSALNATARKRTHGDRSKLLLPGALLVAMQTQLLAPFVLVDFRLAAFFE
jgi:hypothetical protein